MRTASRYLLAHWGHTGTDGTVFHPWDCNGRVAALLVVQQEGPLPRVARGFSGRTPF